MVRPASCLPWDSDSSPGPLNIWTRRWAPRREQGCCYQGGESGWCPSEPPWTIINSLFYCLWAELAAFLGWALAGKLLTSLQLSWLMLSCPHPPSGSPSPAVPSRAAHRPGPMAASPGPSIHTFSGPRRASPESGPDPDSTPLQGGGRGWDLEPWPLPATRDLEEATAHRGCSSLGHHCRHCCAWTPHPPIFLGFCLPRDLS